MRSVILRTLAVMGAGALVLAGVLYVASTVDARPPRVLEIRLTQPTADDDRVALVTTSIVIEIDEPVDPASVGGAISLTPEVPGAASASGSTITFTPGDTLDLDTSYVLTVGPGIRDLAGNPMSDLPGEFEFATAGRPSLVASVPDDAAVDVPLDQPIALTFSSLMDTASVRDALSLEPEHPYELRWSERVLEIVPDEPLRPGTQYVVTVDGRATDVAGVALGDPVAFSFRTVGAGLAPRLIVPADGVEGVAPASAIAVIFDRPIDPDSVSADLLTIDPPVPGSLGVERLPGDADADEPNGAGRALVFTPSAPLPPTTTFEVELAPGLRSTSGAEMSAPIAWSFTTGVPIGEISNQVTFISDRGGIANVWATNPDGSGQRQLTASLTPVTDYVVAPDGSALVIADGRQLTYLRADGSERRILTDAGHLEFDPAFAPDGRTLAFARADALTGEPLGLFTWTVGVADAEPVVMPPEIGASPLPSPTGADAAAPLRAPRYAPDGQALAFVDLRGAVGILELPAQRLTRVAIEAAAPPRWMPDSEAVLLSGRRADGTRPPVVVEGPVLPLSPGADDAVYRLGRSATSESQTRLGVGSRVVAVAPDGEIAYIDIDGALWLTDLDGPAPSGPNLDGVEVVRAAFAPGDRRLVLEVRLADGSSGLEVYDPDTGGRGQLVAEGRMPRWQP